MNDLQIFQLLGLLYFVIGLGMFFNPKFYKKRLNEYAKSDTSLFISGILALVIGYLLITFHNTWDWNKGIIITIVGWIAFLKGVIILAIPKMTDRVMELMKLEKMNFKTLGAGMIVLGTIIMSLGCL